MIAQIILNTQAKKLNKTFDYNIPKDLEDLITIGSKVLIPFGNQKELQEGFVIGIKKETEIQVKDIAKLEGSLKDEQIELAKWMAKRYFCNVSDCIKLMQKQRKKNTRKNNKCNKFKKITRRNRF